LENSSSQVQERYNVDQQQRIEESISNVLRFEQTAIYTPLNHDSNTPTTGLATTQDLPHSSEVGLTEPVSSIAGTENF
jgi:hypothetical protein